MMSQKQKVKQILLETGEISRNQCLAMFISRLSDIMFRLKDEGWDFKTERRNGDYVYKLIPKQVKLDI